MPTRVSWKQITFCFTKFKYFERGVHAPPWVIPQEKKIEKKFEVSSIMNNLIYNLWEIAPHLNDIDSNCSSSCSLQGHNLHAQAMGFVHAFGFVFFSL